MSRKAKAMRDFISVFWRNNNGASIIFFAISLFVLVAMSGLA